MTNRTILIGASPAHHGEYLCGTRRSNRHQSFSDLDNPVLGGEPSKSRSVGHCLDVCLVPESLQDGRMIVSKRNGGNLHEAVQERISVDVADVVSIGFVIVRKECDRGHLLHGIQLLLEGNGFGSFIIIFDRNDRNK